MPRTPNTSSPTKQRGLSTTAATSTSLASGGSGKKSNDRRSISAGRGSNTRSAGKSKEAFDYADDGDNKFAYYSTNNSTTILTTSSSLPATAAATAKRNDNSKTDFVGIVLLLVVIIISIFSYLYSEQGNSSNDTANVFFYAWLTAISTGVGALPFYFIRSLDDYFVGISNAIAGGMMLSASYSLIVEGSNIDEDRDLLYQPFARCLFGVVIGIAFIMVMEVVLDKYEDISSLENIAIVCKDSSCDNDNDNKNNDNNNDKNDDSKSISKLSNSSSSSSSTDVQSNDLVVKQDSFFSFAFGSSGAKKMFLIVMVMTLHSLTEGIGIGVSFAGREKKLGRFISLSLAVHNIPEGLAVALVLTSRNVSVLRSCLWAVFTSLPQPIMAIPAFKFIEYFKKVLPAGLGFAAGAMAYVAVFELLAEAIEVSKISRATVINVAFASFILMTIAQETLREDP